jgi:hypothetical protein
MEGERFYVFRSLAKRLCFNLECRDPMVEIEAKLPCLGKDLQGTICRGDKAKIDSFHSFGAYASHLLVVEHPE